MLSSSSTTRMRPSVPGALMPPWWPAAMGRGCAGPESDLGNPPTAVNARSEVVRELKAAADGMPLSNRRPNVERETVAGPRRSTPRCRRAAERKKPDVARVPVDLRAGEAHVLLTGELDVTAMVPIERAVERAFTTGAVGIVLNLDGVTFID